MNTFTKTLAYNTESTGVRSRLRSPGGVRYIITGRRSHIRVGGSRLRSPGGVSFTRGRFINQGAFHSPGGVSFTRGRFSHPTSALKHRSPLPAAQHRRICRLSPTTNRDLRNEKTRGMFHYLTKRPPTMPFSGKQRPSRSRLSRKQEMERPHNEGKQHHPQSSRTCCVHNKRYKLNLVQVYVPTISYSDEDITNL